MTVISCSDCNFDQDVRIDSDTYGVECDRCGDTIEVPRKLRGDRKSELGEKSSVNIRVGFSLDGDMMNVGWTVQSANKRNRYMEKDAVSVDVSHHPNKLYWYVAVFKMMQHINGYKEGRIWVKDGNMINHFAGESNISSDDLRMSMKEQIVKLVDEKFLGCEFVECDNVGNDIKKMVR